MYAHFYQLNENPFNLTPDPKFHYVNESTREAMASLLHGIKSRKGFIALIAEAGTGKTTLLKRIVDEIEGETQIVFVFNPGVSFDELLEFICSELGIETRGCKRLHLLDRLNQYLLEQLTVGRNVVVMIDEAQTLEDSVLEELRLLSNLETSKEKILQILLSGQPELDDKLRRPSLRQLRQRIGVRATLKPVQLNEMQAYVETRLRSAGAERADLFTPAALKRVWQASGGIPRVINVICDNAMMVAFAEGQKRITPKTLNEAVRDLGGLGEDRDLGVRARDWLTSRTAGYALAAAAVVAAGVPLATMLLRGFEAPRDAASSQVTVRASGGSAPATAPRAVIEHAVAASPTNPPDQGPHAPVVAADETIVADAADGDEFGVVSESEDLATRRALESDPTQRRAIADSIRRAEVIARSTAARIYGAGDAKGSDAATHPDIADAALAEVAGDRGSTGFDPPPAVEPSADAKMDDAASVAKATAAEVVAPLPITSEPEKLVEIDAAAPAVAAAPVVVAAKPVAKPAAKPLEKSAAKTAVKPDVRKSAEVPAKVVPPVAGSDVRAADAKPAAAAPAVAVSEAAAAAPPVVAGRPPASLGRLVAVEDGDTVWDIAIRYYGGAGPATLKGILASNPAILDPLKLEVGTIVFLPFSRPEQMINREGNGYRVLLAAAPTRQSLAVFEEWARTINGEVRIGILTVGQGRQLYELYVAGLPSESAALDLATSLLEPITALMNPPQRTAMR